MQTPPIAATIPLLALLLPLAAAAAPQAATGPAAEGVTIYRCTDAKGRLSLRDSPCLPGERQEVRSMQRPKDGPPRPVIATPAPREDFHHAAPPATQVVYLQPPRTLYECVTPDNTRYLSDTADGNPRIVPMWVTDGPAIQTYREYEPGQLQVSVNNGQISGGYTSGRWRDRIVTGWPGQHWIRDACHAVPQNEVCARLRDRREEVRRRFSIAQPSERATLGSEERSINARLSQECP